MLLVHNQGGRMPRQNRQIIAAHYFYLLKEDSEGLRKLWSQLASSATLARDAGAEGENSAIAALAPDSSTESDRCSIMHCAGNGELDLCLAMLRNLALVEVVRLEGPERNGGEIGSFMDFIDGQRRQALAEGVSLFGESTMIVAGDGGKGVNEEQACLLIANRLEGDQALHLPGLDQSSAAAAAPNCRKLTSALAPELSGGGNPNLTLFPSPENSPVAYYVLKAADPERIVSTLFPELDSLLKELERATAFFREQRSSIVEENSSIDKQVGALLHRQVISMDAENPDTAELESRIADLSRMFGLLATDSLMTRQAEKRLEKDLGALRTVLSRVMNPTADSDGIGEYHLGLYGTELKAIRTVSSDLDHSRQNAEAAIDVVRTQVELLRAEEEAEIQSQTRGLLDQILKLQEEGLALQVAAGLIEFVLIFYYVLISWEHLLGVEEAEHISPIVRIIPVAGIAAGAALGTHFLARSIKNKTWKNPGLWVSAVMLLMALVGLVILSISTLTG